MATNPFMGGPITMSIKACKCTKFEFTSFAISNQELIANDKYEFSFSINFRPSDVEQLIDIEVSSLLTLLDEPKDKIAELNSINTFVIQDYKNIIVRIGDNPPIIAPNIASHLISLSITALRGMWAIKLADSLYENAVFPMIDLTKTMENAKPLPPSP
jgi:hypothetical protein